MTIKTVGQQIIDAGRKLAQLDPSHQALAYAREWWADGQLSKYSNQDLDILQSLRSACQK